MSPDNNFIKVPSFKTVGPVQERELERGITSLGAQDLIAKEMSGIVNASRGEPDC